MREEKIVWYMYPSEVPKGKLSEMFPSGKVQVIRKSKEYSETAIVDIEEIWLISSGVEGGTNITEDVILIAERPTVILDPK